MCVCMVGPVVCCAYIYICGALSIPPYTPNSLSPTTNQHPPTTHQVIRRLVGGGGGGGAHSGEEKRLDVPLSLGGRAAGSLSLRIKIHKREYAYELVRPHLPLRGAAGPPDNNKGNKPRVEEGGWEEEAKEEEGEGGDGRVPSRRRVNFEEGGPTVEG